MTGTGEYHDPNIVSTIVLQSGDCSVRFQPPIRVESADFDDDNCITMGRLAYRAALGPNAPPRIANLSHEGRIEYARRLERYFNDKLGRNTDTHNYNDDREHAGAIYTAFLIVGIIAIVENVNSFVPPPPADIQ